MLNTLSHTYKSHQTYRVILFKSKRKQIQDFNENLMSDIGVINPNFEMGYRVTVVTVPVQRVVRTSRAMLQIRNAEHYYVDGNNYAVESVSNRLDEEASFSEEQSV